MSRKEKLLNKLLSSQNDKNFKFDDIVLILINLDFEFRIKGSHHIFYHKNVSGILNLKSKSDGTAKEYQVKQVRNYINSKNILEDL